MEARTYSWAVGSSKYNTLARAYLNHMVASYQYDIDGKEYGEIGHSDGLIKSRNYKKLF